MAEAAQTEDPPKPKASLPIRDLAEAEGARNTWQAVCPHSTPYEHLLTQPDIWSHVGNKLGNDDFIEVHAEDRSWLALLVVREASQTGSLVAEIWRVHFDKHASLMNEA